MRRLLFDTESDGLLATATKLHCLAAIDVDTGHAWDCDPNQIDDAIRALDQADVLIGHNIQRHDIPLITKLTGWRPRKEVVIRDTMICARLIYPNVKDTDHELIRTKRMPAGKKYQGKHTLGAWGYRLGCHKGDYAEIKEAEARAHGLTDDEAILRYVWGAWNEEMHRYMVQDRSTNHALWQHLRVDSYSAQAVELEHRIAFICDQMERAGVPFDVGAAGKLHSTLVGRRGDIEQELTERFGFWFAPVSPNPQKALFTPKRDNARIGYVAGAQCTKLKLVQFNPSSRDHIAKVLLAKGWQPTEFTDGGKPAINEETVEAICAAYPEFSGLGEYLMIDKRISQLATGTQAWLKRVDDKGYIHGVINPMGTTTGRAAHMLPNLGQVPKVASPYGADCRSLFYAPDGWEVVGADQQGLELRGLAHYLHPLDEGRYANVVLDGDPHWVNAVAMGLADGERDKSNKLHAIIREDGSKRFIYACIYGCGGAKAGEIIYTCLISCKATDPIAGEELYKRFFKQGVPDKDALANAGYKVLRSFAKRLDGYGKLKERIAHNVQVGEGWITGLDGRKVPIRSEHSALNFLIQGAGAIICKRWVCDAFDALQAAGLKYDFENPWNGDFVFCLWVHDEIQVWCRKGLGEKVAAILKETAAKAGEPYGFRVRLDGDAKVGKNWKETH